MQRLRDKKRAVVLLQGEKPGEIKKMIDAGVNGFIVDNESDLKKICSFIDDARIFLRIKIKEHTVYTGKYFVYGFDWKAVPELLKKYRGRFGLHFHRKTQNIGEWSLKEDFGPVIEAVGSGIEWMNIGGGIPAEYHNSHPDFQPIAKEITDFREYLKEKSIGLILEPGRYIAAPAVKLETEVILKYAKTLVVDASIYNAYLDTFLFHMRLPVEGEVNAGHEYLIKGKSPDSLDILRYRVFFPKEKKEGDKIVFLNAGAYNFHTEFADLEKIRTEVVRA